MAAPPATVIGGRPPSSSGAPARKGSRKRHERLRNGSGGPFLGVGQGVMPDAVGHLLWVRGEAGGQTGLELRSTNDGKGRGKGRRTVGTSRSPNTPARAGGVSGHVAVPGKGWQGPRTRLGPKPPTGAVWGCPGMGRFARQPPPSAPGPAVLSATGRTGGSARSPQPPLLSLRALGGSRVPAARGHRGATCISPWRRRGRSGLVLLRRTLEGGTLEAQQPLSLRRLSGRPPSCPPAAPAHKTPDGIERARGPPHGQRWPCRKGRGKSRLGASRGGWHVCCPHFLRHEGRSEGARQRGRWSRCKHPLFLRITTKWLWARLERGPQAACIRMTANGTRHAQLRMGKAGLPPDHPLHRSW